MSLLPRYAALPFPAPLDLPGTVRAWMAEWPVVADMYGAMGRNVDLRPRVTTSTIDLPGACPQEGGHAPRDLVVSADGERGRLIVIEASSGRRVTPVFLGVSAPSRLPPIAQFLLHLGAHRTSLLEIVYRILNEIILDHMATVRDLPLHFPRLFLGDRILPSPRTVLLPASALPAIPTPVSRRGFFTFHEWLLDHELPTGLVQTRVGIGERDPLWIDLAHPEGVNSFLRYTHGAETVMLVPALMADDQGFKAREGCFEVEFYVELVAGTLVTH